METKTRQELIEDGFTELKKNLQGLLGKMEGENTWIYMPINDDRTKYTLMYHGKFFYVQSFFPTKKRQ